MGEVFAGRYELIVPIAEGGMGTVWEVHDRNDDQVKAAKILRQSDAASLLRFVREQSMRIDHRHVVTRSPGPAWTIGCCSRCPWSVAGRWRRC